MEAVGYEGTEGVGSGAWSILRMFSAAVLMALLLGFRHSTPVTVSFPVMV